MVSRSACLLLALAIVAGCSHPTGDGIVFAVASAPRVLDPRLATDAASDRVNALLYESLFLLDEQGNARPNIAAWQRLAPDHYRITLHPDRAPFWDERPLQAADVAFTYRSLLDPALGSPHRGPLQHILAVDVIDDDTLEFRLTRSDPRFPSRLTVGVVPAPADRGVSLNREPLGSGTFAFVRQRDDGGVELRRRADGQVISIVPVKDPTMRTLKLIRAEAQLLQNDLPAELFDFLAAQNDVQLSEQPGTTFAYLGFNLDDPVVGQREVRAAIAHAIDREAIVRYLFAERARLAESVLRPQHWAAAHGLQPYAHDPARARALLESLGYGTSNPLVLQYKTSTDPFRLRIAHVLQQQLAAVGIDLQIASYDWGTFFGDIKAGRFQLYSLAWVGVNTPDILRYAFHSASLPPAGANRGRLHSPGLDALIERAEASDTAAAVALYAEAQRLIHEALVYVPLWYEDNVAASRDVVGYRPGFDGNYLALNQVQWREASK